jgi:hypothetical protein
VPNKNLSLFSATEAGRGKLPGLLFFGLLGFGGINLIFAPNQPELTQIFVIIRVNLLQTPRSQSAVFC